jgi:hypothetical protein
VTPDEFADQIKEFVIGSLDRATGIGAEQYSDGDTQQFETMTMDELREMTKQELQDVVNYTVMQHIRFERIYRAWAGHLAGAIHALDEAPS